VRSTFRIRPELAIAVVVAGLTLIGWVARTTLAQNSPQKPAETLPSPPPVAGDVKAVLSVPGSILPPAPVVSARSPFELDPSSGLPPAAESDDPEKNVQAFVEQNRKVAETQLKSLRDEAEKLRTRLQKVEAGIHRWETLLTALQTSEAAPGRGELEPIPHARRGFNARVVRPPVAPRDEPTAPRPEPGSAKPTPSRDVPQDLEPAPTPPAAPR
jgi:hypothetical protein